MDNRRQQFLNKHFTKRVIEVFAQWQPEEEDKPLSCAEVVAVLEHTIEAVKSDIPLDFGQF